MEFTTESQRQIETSKIRIAERLLDVPTDGKRFPKFTKFDFPSVFSVSPW